MERVVKGLEDLFEIIPFEKFENNKSTNKTQHKITFPDNKKL